MKHLVKTFGIALMAMLCMSNAAFAAQPVKALIPVKIESDDSGNTYEVVIEPITAGAPMPETDTLSLKEGEQTTLEIEYDAPDTYSYRMYEKRGEDEAATYDERIYTVYVFAEENDDGVLNPVIVIEDPEKDTKPESVCFENAYRPEPTPTPGEDTPTPTPTPGEDTPTPTPTPGEDTPTPTPTPGEDTPTPTPTPGENTPTPTPSTPTGGSRGGTISSGGTYSSGGVVSTGGGVTSTSGPIQTGDAIPYAAIIAGILGIVVLTVARKKADN